MAAWLKAASGRVPEAFEALEAIARQGAPVAPARALEEGSEGLKLLSPLDAQEVWACGVTYEMSREARMRESEEPTIYGRVYEAERPEIFFKATPHRTVGPGEAVGIRGDSTWDVPEPELTLVVTPALEIVGYTVGNDMSSRSIEGENPLYLPQAKVYDRCCALGPAVRLARDFDPLHLGIRLTIWRGGVLAFEGTSHTSKIHRPLEELVRYLGRCNRFPEGVFVLTGTGIVPPDTFTLAEGDLVEITIEGIGTLRNPVVELPIL
ncbi:MAG: fumarylacetoacetate hydrolase family protein [Chloroflexi bacterium]|nr:fumarylacetoacetate hydrolase family protein [Chloroflexota bacterium]